MISGLPVSLQKELLRAKGTGTSAVQLRGVSIQSLYTTAPVADRIALTQQIADIEQQIRRIKDELAALKLQCNFVQSLGEKSVDIFSQSLARKNVSLKQTKELLNFVEQEHNNYAMAIAQKERACTHLAALVFLVTSTDSGIW